MNITRRLSQQVASQLYKGKTIIILGARRVGKTYMCKTLVEQNDGVYYNCELQETKELLQMESKVSLGKMIQGKRLVVFDEAQDILDIGRKLKILHDSFPQVQFVATGSSSFDLHNKTAEPLTGRSRVYKMYPLSMSELVDNIGISDAHGNLDNVLRYGSYPDVFLNNDNEKIEELENITANYLYKDVLKFGDLKKPELIKNLLQLLAFQIGGEVSLNQLSNQTNVSIHTVKRYLDMLEKSFVLFSIGGFSRNLRKEIGKSKKYYFCDLGIRNSIIKNYNPLNLRNDVGMLWENYCVLERFKRNNYNREFKNTYFWRTYDQQEIDFIEEYDGRLNGYEFKYNNSKYRKPAIFLKTYTGSEIQIINKKNYFDFVM